MILKFYKYQNQFRKIKKTFKRVTKVRYDIVTTHIDTTSYTLTTDEYVSKVLNFRAVFFFAFLKLSLY